MINVALLAIFAATASPLIASAALAATWWGWRSRQLRKSDVLSWTLQAIEVLQTLSLILVDQGTPVSEQESELRRLRVRASVLIEQGRLFFRNSPSKNHGLEKPAAFSGLRPCILDELVIGFQVAGAAISATTEYRYRLAAISVLATRRFVSMAQGEVGRERSASVVASKGGSEIHLESLSIKLTEHDLRHARSLYEKK